MFPRGYFPPDYFAPGYWGDVGGAAFADGAAVGSSFSTGSASGVASRRSEIFGGANIIRAAWHTERRQIFEDGSAAGAGSSRATARATALASMAATGRAQSRSWAIGEITINPAVLMADNEFWALAA